MEPLKWPKLSHTNPTSIKEHAKVLSDDFKAVLDFVSADVSDVAPSLPRGIERKIAKGIQKGLIGINSCDHNTASISVQDSDLKSKTILTAITAETAAAFHNRVPQHLFRILRDSSDELKLKILTQEDAAPQGSRRVGTASGDQVLPHTPPDSPPEEADSELAIDYGSDTEALAYHDWEKSTILVDSRIKKLKGQLQEVEHERKAVRRRLKAEAGKIEKEVQELELERDAVDREHKEVLEAMNKRRLEQDRTGDYETDSVGYNLYESLDFFHGKNGENARVVNLKIESQAVVTRLFNMTANVLTRKAMAAVKQKGEPVGGTTFPSITHFLGAELRDDGNITLWAHGTDEYDWQEADAFDGLGKMPSWDQDMVASFASHVLERSENYLVEVKDVDLEMVDLQDRKRRAAMITDLVKKSVTTIPSLHIDVVKQICIYRRTTRDNTKALVLYFSNPVTANEVISHGLQWQGRWHPCEVYDPKFLDRCGRCQIYGHHAPECREPPRCGTCAGPHGTKLCISKFSKCASCDGPHTSSSSRCPAKRGRILDKLNARFPTRQDHQPFAIPTAEPEASRPSLSSPAPNLPNPHFDHPETTKECRPDSQPTPVHSAPSDPQVEHTSTTKERPSDPGPASVNIAQPDTPTLLARQLQDMVPAIEAALWSDFPEMRREPTQSAIKAVPQLEEQKCEKRRKLEEPSNEAKSDDEIL